MAQRVEGGIIFTDPQEIEAVGLLSLKHRLRLECLGLKGRGTSAYSIVKSRFGFTGGKSRVLAQFEQFLSDHNIPPR